MKQNWYSSSLEKRLGEGDLESRKQSREQEDSEAGGRGSPRQIQVMEGAGGRGRGRAGMEQFKEGTGSYNWRHFYSLALSLLLEDGLREDIPNENK